MRVVVAGLLVLIVACSEPARESGRVMPSEVEASPASHETGDPSTPLGVTQRVTQGNITIEAIDVGNPLVVRGRARTFENAVSVRALDGDGKVITEAHTTARGEMGQHNPYEATLWLTREPGKGVIVEALEYSAKDGSEQSLVREERPFEVAPVRVELYLPNADCTAVKPVQRTMPKSLSLARLVTEALVREQPFPKDAAVRSVILRDGVLTVDFNERLQNVGGACAAQMICASVTETLRRLPNVREVVITAGGSRELALQP